MEYGIDDAIDTLHVYKANHGTGAPTHLHKATLNDIGGPQLPPQVLGKLKDDNKSGRSFSSCFSTLGSAHQAAEPLTLFQSGTLIASRQLLSAYYLTLTNRNHVGMA